MSSLVTMGSAFVNTEDVMMMMTVLITVMKMDVVRDEKYMFNLSYVYNVTYTLVIWRDQ